MATKIRLKRQGKKFYAFYRVVVVDSRKKRDGKARIAAVEDQAQKLKAAKSEAAAKAKAEAEAAAAAEEAPAEEAAEEAPAEA
mgnify:CR=1 FL=1